MAVTRKEVEAVLGNIVNFHFQLLREYELQEYDSKKLVSISEDLKRIIAENWR